MNGKNDNIEAAIFTIVILLLGASLVFMQYIIEFIKSIF